MVARRAFTEHRDGRSPACASPHLAVAEAAAAGSDQDICGVLVATLAGNDPTIGTGTWSQVSGPGTITFSWLMPEPPVIIAMAILAFILFWRHRSNIANLLSGREGKITFGKNKDV